MLKQQMLIETVLCKLNWLWDEMHHYWFKMHLIFTANHFPKHTRPSLSQAASVFTWKLWLKNDTKSVNCCEIFPVVVDWRACEKIYGLTSVCQLLNSIWIQERAVCGPKKKKIKTTKQKERMCKKEHHVNLVASWSKMTAALKFFFKALQNGWIQRLVGRKFIGNKFNNG